MSKPRLAVTMGDPLGIGPEIIAASWSEPQLAAACRRIVVGQTALMRRAVNLLNASIEVQSATAFDEADDDPRRMVVLDVAAETNGNEPFHFAQAAAGQLAHDCIVKAARAALVGEVDGLVTAPINKAALAAARCEQIGHTELLAAVTGVQEVAMLLYLPQGPALPHNEIGLGVVHVTLHEALREVFERLKIPRIVRCCELVTEFCTALLSERGQARLPRVAVAALNPHGGEGGLFGREEIEIIAPAVQQAQRREIPVVGPYPVDTLMARGARGEFDAIVAMYHDQGHIALKLLGMNDAVNVTLGLPIVRTSVAHGTAYEIAWQGRAQCGSMVQATRIAAALAGPRMKAGRSSPDEEVVRGECAR